MRTRWLYFRLFGLTALIAAASYWAQLPGLAGSRGLWPIAQTMFWLRARSSFFDVPSLCWLSSSDATLHALCGGAVVCALLVVVDVALPWAVAGFFLCWASLVNVGQPFLSFQWDILLCEAAAFSFFYALRRLHEPMLWQRLLVALAAVKVTLESGIVKLTAGDPSWWPDLTALTYHYWTQPLPTWTSVALDRLPLWMHQATCLFMFVLELGVPLLAFVPLRRARAISALGMIALQLGLGFAGNYSYFNLLAAALSIPLLDDALLTRLKWPVLPEPKTGGPAWLQPTGWSLFAAAVLASALDFGGQFSRDVPAPPLQAYRFLSSYGAFRIMTKTRPEIIVEGSSDRGATWRAYEFKWKPGRVDVRPKWVAPWQPRLDWQMWFAALGDCGGNPWLLNLQQHLMLGTPEVLALMGDDPFPGKPPTLMRTTTWQYRFAPRGSSDWWARTYQGPYCPALTLDAAGNLTRADQGRQ